MAGAKHEILTKVTKSSLLEEQRAKRASGCKQNGFIVNIQAQITLEKQYLQTGVTRSLDQIKFDRRKSEVSDFVFQPRIFFHLKQSKIAVFSRVKVLLASYALLKHAGQGIISEHRLVLRRLESPDMTIDEVNKENEENPAHSRSDVISFHFTERK